MFVQTLTITFTTLSVILTLSEAATISFQHPSISTEVDQPLDVILTLSSPLSDNVTVEFTYYVGGRLSCRGCDRPVVQPLPPIEFPAHTTHANVTLTPARVGSVVIGINTTSPLIERWSSVYMSVYVVHHRWLTVFAEVLGWGFFILWSVCAYPLTYTVVKTRSFAGVSYGFVALNNVSFIAYTIYSATLYFSTTVQAEYREKHPGGVQPVQPEDVALTTHLSVLFTVLCVLAIFFDSGGQRLGLPLTLLCAGFVTYAVVLLILTLSGAITWLRAIYGLALIKMITMPMKYIPQVYQNHKRRSTAGFNVFFSWFDLAAGTLTIIQMVVIATNGDDWSSFLGNLPKVVLGGATVVFDVMLLTQHYCLYKGNTPYIGIKDVVDKRKEEPHLGADKHETDRTKLVAESKIQ